MTQVLTANSASSVQEIFDYQDSARRTKKYQAIGQVKCIVLEDSAARPAIPQELTDREGLRLDWLGGGPHLGTVGGQLMFTTPVPTLPPRPPAVWVPKFAPYFTKKTCELCGGKGERMTKVAPTTASEKIDNRCARCEGKGEQDDQMVVDKPPIIPRPFEIYASGKMPDSNLLVIQPVAQILVAPEGLSVYWIITCSKDPATQTEMALVIDPDTRAGYFFGGLYDIKRF